jgi:hypothetical protein
MLACCLILSLMVWLKHVRGILSLSVKRCDVLANSAAHNKLDQYSIALYLCSIYVRNYSILTLRSIIMWFSKIKN